jgi:hypothetical protein
MKRFAWLIVVLVGAFFCLGMGDLGGQPEGTIPETDLKIAAKVVDREGVETSLEQFSMDGKTYLDTQRGSGKLTIPFQQLESVSFGKLSGDEMAVQVKFKSGTVMDLTIGKRALFYGSTGYGAFVIKARDLSRIEFP